MGLTMWVALLVENVKCRSVWAPLGSELLLWGTLGGTIGSLVSLVDLYLAHLILTIFILSLTHCWVLRSNKPSSHQRQNVFS